MNTIACIVEEKFDVQSSDDKFDPSITCRFMSIKDSRLISSEEIDYFIQLDHEPRFIAVLSTSDIYEDSFSATDSGWRREGGGVDGYGRSDSAYIKWIDSRPDECEESIHDLIEVMWEIWFAQKNLNASDIDLPPPPPGFRLFR